MKQRGRKVPAVTVQGLSFSYQGSSVPALDNVTLTLSQGERCLLVGRNGAGKTTLLRVLAGRHLVHGDAVRVLGRPVFDDTSLAQRVVYVGGRFPFDVDVTVAEILEHTPCEDQDRRERLLDLLGVSPTWHMDRVSDGQRRRVQLLLALLRPVELLLLDEALSDLDLVGRCNILGFLREESERRGTTILYATHILEEVETWATSVALMEWGRLVELKPLSDLRGRLLEYALAFLRGSREEQAQPSAQLRAQQRSSP